MDVVVPADPSIQLRPINRSEYARLFGPDGGERVELIEGVVVAVPPMKDPHASVLSLLNHWLSKGLPDDVMVRPQLPLAVSDYSEPEPDIAVVDFAAHTGDHPHTAHLVIEVTDTTHWMDLRVKPLLYAAAGVPAYWVVDLRDRVVVVHTQPSAAEGYRDVERHGAGAVLDAQGVAIAVDELLPPA